MNITLPQISSCSPRIALRPDPLRVERLTWGREPGWNQFVNDHSEATVFHTLAWRNAVRASFKHDTEYLLAIRDNRIEGVLPLFLLRGPVIGRMLVSVPYAVGGGIIAQNPEAAAALISAARRTANDHNCSSVDLRSSKASVPDVVVNTRYLSFERELPENVEDVAEWLPRKARAVVRNAHSKFGLTCESEPDSLRVVWELYCRNMRRLASINYPYRFFESLKREFGDQCWLSVVRRDGRPVAGLLTLTFRERVVPYFFGCEPDARTCGAANLIYFNVMEKGVADGFRIFDFGRSRRDNTGSCDFKRFHGFEARPLEYQRITLTASRPVDLTPTNPALGLIRSIWPRLPMSVTRPAGEFLSQYIPG